MNDTHAPSTPISETHAKAREAEQANWEQHHYFATHAMGYACAETKEAAIKKLMLENTDPTWVRNCLKDGAPLVMFACRVPLPIDAHYAIEWFIPKVDGITEPGNHMVTYLTKTKYAIMDDPNDQIKILQSKLDQYETDEYRVAKNAVLHAADDYLNTTLGDLTDEEATGLTLAIQYMQKL